MTKENYLVNPKTCACCNSVLPYSKRWNKYCSSSCAAKSNNTTRKLKRITKISKEKICKHCKTTFVATGIADKNNVYCSLCIDNNYHTIKVHKLSDAKRDSTRRKFLIKTNGHKCMCCNNTDWNNLPIPLEIDHIDGNSSNNDEANLRLLCPNCHAQTSSYKGKNKGKGRFVRSKRYKLGLSY